MVDDLKLIKKYQSLDDDGKETVDFILNKEYKRCSSIDYAVTTSDDPHIIIEVAQAQRTLNAAHVDNNAVEENKKHDKAIIDNDNF